MTDRKIMQQALDALKLIDEAMPFPVAKLTIKNLSERLAQPEQEPVAWEDVLGAIARGWTRRWMYSLQLRLRKRFKTWSSHSAHGLG